MIEEQSSVAEWHPKATTLLVASLRSPMLRLLVTIDLLLILMHVNVALSPDEVQGAWSDFFRIDRDLSLSEWF
jgi:predicted SnoaL-like aldol condensation-catalyzing enzyme